MILCLVSCYIAVAYPAQLKPPYPQYFILHLQHCCWGIRRRLASVVSAQLCVTLQVLAYIDQARAGLTIVSGGLLLVALFTTAQYRSAVTDTTLVELGLGASALVGREVLRRFSQRFYEGTGPVYNFKRKS